jgi:hypothetical protein
MKTVTHRDWSVSTTSTGSGFVTLHVFRIKGRKIAKGEGYGRTFPTHESAMTFALEHGYLEPFVTAWCRHCRQAHTFLGRRSGFCHTLGVFTGAAGVYNVRTGAVDSKAAA